MSRIALITGITGQDGALLCEHLLSKDYYVYGLARQTSTSNTSRIDRFANHPNLEIIRGDLTDGACITNLVRDTAPDEIYNLAAQSHVHESFKSPVWTAQVNAIGPLYLLEAIRCGGLKDKTRFYQASTSEVFGNSEDPSQSEGTRFKPASPYASAKVFAHNLCVNYRQAYQIHASNGILFNHESPLRGDDFVSRKITLAACRIENGEQSPLKLGNLDAVRDWGDAREFVVFMWKILQQDGPDDYVLSTGQTATVRDFATLAFRQCGIEIEWTGEGAQEKGINRKSKATLIEVDPDLYRPVDVNFLCGDSRKAQRKLGWDPGKASLEKLVEDMIDSDRQKLKKPAFEEF